MLATVLPLAAAVLAHTHWGIPVKKQAIHSRLLAQFQDRHYCEAS